VNTLCGKQVLGHKEVDEDMMNSGAGNVNGGGGGECTQLRQSGDEAGLGRGETGAYVCGVVLERCRRGNLGTLAATPCAMQRGSLAYNTPVVPPSWRDHLARLTTLGKIYTVRVEWYSLHAYCEYW